MKKGVFKNSTKFTGKHLCQSLFFNKVAGLTSATLLEKIQLATLSQYCGLSCHNVVARSKMRVATTSVSRRCYNVATTLGIWFLDQIVILDRFITRELQKYLSIESSL